MKFVILGQWLFICLLLLMLGNALTNWERERGKRVRWRDLF
jgi:hypothetical protein